MGNLRIHGLVVANRMSSSLKVVFRSCQARQRAPPQMILPAGVKKALNLSATSFNILMISMTHF